RDVRADAAVAQKFAARVKEGFAAGADVDRESRPVDGTINQIAKWTMPFERRLMVPPFLGFQFDIGCKLPTLQHNQAGGGDAGGVVFRQLRDAVVRPCLPEPVGGRFGVIAKALLAFTKRKLGSPAVLDIRRRPVPLVDLAIFVAQRLGAEQEPAIFAVEAPQP